MVQQLDLNRLDELERMLREAERDRAYERPARRSLKDTLLPRGDTLAGRWVSSAPPSDLQLVRWDDSLKRWKPDFLTPGSFASFPSFGGGDSVYQFYFIDSESKAAGLALGNSDTLANPVTGAFDASLYYINLGYYDEATGNSLGRTDGWYTPSPANLGASDTAADGGGPYFYINGSSGFNFAAHPTLDTIFRGFAIVYFGLGDGTGQPLRLESRAGTPTHSATEATLCVDRTANILYVNTDGGTTWAAIASAASVTAAVAAHEAASDPHAGYVREADASWIDLTDSGATTLHSHTGGGMKRGSYFPLPTAVTAGVTLTKSAVANTLGAFATIATPTGDGYIMGVVIEDASAANNYGYLVIDASPRFVAGEAETGVTASATITFTLGDISGTAPVANDIIIVKLIAKNNTESITVPAGWTKFVEVNWGATDEHRTTIAWKRSAGAEGNADFSKLTNDGNLLWGVASLWRGCVTSGSPISGTATTSDNASSDTVTYATFTPGYAGDTVVAAGFYADDQTTLTLIAGIDPTFASNLDLETSVGTDASIFLQSGPSISGFPTGAKTHITTSTTDAVNLGVLFGLTGGGSAVVKFSSTAAAATGQYGVPLPIPVKFLSGHVIRGAWAGNNAAGDTCVVSLTCAGGLQDL